MEILRRFFTFILSQNDCVKSSALTYFKALFLFLFFSAFFNTIGPLVNNEKQISCLFKEQSHDKDYLLNFCYSNPTPNISEKLFEKYFKNGEFCVKNQTLLKNNKNNNLLYKGLRHDLLICTFAVFLPFFIFQLSQLSLKYSVVTQDGKKTAINFYDFSHYFYTHFWMYMLCLLCLAASSVIVLFLLNSSTDGAFVSLGITYFNHWKLSNIDNPPSTNPLCETFPIHVSCWVNTFDGKGNISPVEGLCSLNENYYVQKNMIIIWMFVMISFLITPLTFLYWTLLSCKSKIRVFALKSKSCFKKNVLKKVIKLALLMDFPDFFMFYTIVKVASSEFNEEFINTLYEKYGLSTSDNVEENNDAENIEINAMS